MDAIYSEDSVTLSIFSLWMVRCNVSIKLALSSSLDNKRKISCKVAILLT